MSENSRSNNRRSELTEAAIEAFVEHGFEGTSVADLVTVVGMSKAAFGYHFESKDALLVELATPLLDALAQLETAITTDPEDIARYLDVLLTHADVVAWIDGDRSALSHPVVGTRISDHLSRVRTAWGDGSDAGEVRASMAIAALWRPIRNLEDRQIVATKDTVITTVAAMLARS
jgi:AcrR family transcriptional regulator